MMANIDSVLKSRDITLPTKMHIVSVFTVVMCGCESWTIKKAECQTIDAFELWCWRKLLKVSWTVGRSTQYIHWKDWCWCWSTRILVIWCAQMTHWKSPWCWKRWRAEGEDGIRRWDGWMASLMQWTWTWASSGSWWGTGKPGVLRSMGCKESDTTGWLKRNNMHEWPYFSICVLTPSIDAFFQLYLIDILKLYAEDFAI